MARAIGVSESSLKRWCDSGKIPAVRTAGGHRRLPIAGVLAFLKASDLPVVEPEILGLPSATGSGVRTSDRACELLLQALIKGDEELSRRILFDLYLAGFRVARIGDEVISPALAEIGKAWGCGELELYEERRSCEIALRILHEIRLTIPTPKDGPMAIGGTLTGDYYVLPTTLVELTLRQCGWRAISLGTALTAETLVHAIEGNRPRLVWVSASFIEDEMRFIESCAAIQDAAGKVNAALIVGGRELTESLRKKIRYSAYCDDLTHLESLARSLAGPSVTVVEAGSRPE